MKIETVETTRIVADEGKVLRRIFDNQIFGREVSLGYTYRIGDIVLDKPLKELPEYFEEIDDPELTTNKTEIDETK